jgi:hypothetical protein
MPLLKRGVLIPCKGVDFSMPATFIDERNGFPQNMRYWQSEMRKGTGKTKYGSVAIAGGQIMGLGKLELSGDVKYLIRASKTKVERYNTTTGLWQSISAQTWTGGDEEFIAMESVQEEGTLILTNGKDNIRKWPGSGPTEDLGGSPPKAKYMTYLTPYLILAHIDDGVSISPWKVQWNDTSGFEVWSGGNSGAQLLSTEASPLMNILRLNEYAVAYKKNSIWLGARVSTKDVISFNCVHTGTGLEASWALAEGEEGVHYIMGANDFYRFGGIRPESIGGPVRDEVFNILDRTKINRCHAISVPELGEVWFFIVRSGYSWPKDIYKYNYRYGFWYYDTCNNITRAVKWIRTATQSWDDDTPGDWYGALDVWDSGTVTQNYEEVLLGRDDGHTLKLDPTITNDDGNAIDSFFVSKDFSGDKLEIMKRWLQLDVWAKGPGKLYVDYSTDYGETWKSINALPTRAYLDLTDRYIRYSMFFDIVSEVIRFRFRNYESGEMFYLRNFYPYYLERERSI